MNLFTSGRLNGYLADVDRQAKERFSRLGKKPAETQGVTEQLKADEPMLWVGRMNAVRSAATQAVNSEVIFV